MEEIWKPIKNLAGYEVSNTGKVRNKNHRLLKRHKNDAFQFMINGVRYYRPTILLVAEAFVPNPNGYDKARIKFRNGWTNKIYNRKIDVNDIEWYPSKNWVDIN